MSCFHNYFSTQLGLVDNHLSTQPPLYFIWSGTKLSLYTITTVPYHCCTSFGLVHNLECALITPVHNHLSTKAWLYLNCPGTQSLWYTILALHNSGCTFLGLALFWSWKFFDLRFFLGIYSFF